MLENLKRREKQSVISFDTLYNGYGEKQEVETLYNKYNALYSNDDIIKLPKTSLDIVNRRMMLEGLFRNRVGFLLLNTISHHDEFRYTSIDTLEKKFPFVFNIHNFMTDISNSTLLDYSTLICSTLYNNMLKDYDDHNLNITSQKEDLSKILINDIFNMLNIVYKEANTIYLDAGIPGYNLNEGINLNEEINNGLFDI